VEKTINQTIQNTLNQLEKDCDHIGALVDSAVDEDNRSRSHNLRAKGKGFLLFALGIVLPAAVVANFFASSLSDQLLADALGKEGMEALRLYLAPVRGFWSSLPDEYHVYALLTLTALSACLLLAARWVAAARPTMTRGRKRTLLEKQDFVRTVVKAKKVGNFTCFVPFSP